MKTTDSAERYAALAREVLERELRPDEGIAPARIAAAQTRLGFALPPALREYYRVMGACDEINKNHDRLIALEELEEEDGQIIFLADHQNVAFWSVRVADESDDPLVWQATNDQPLQWFTGGWFERELPVTEFFWERFSWVFGLGDNNE